MLKNKKIVIVAGDRSGDLYGKNLAIKLNEQIPGCQIYSFAGPLLAGCSRQKLDLVSHSVCGLVEVLASLSKFQKLFQKTYQLIQTIGPGLVILIDFPDFNLRLAKKINQKYPVYYYISPQVWAWRQKRVKIIKKYCQRMITIFNFEQLIYQKEKIPVFYFGHPLLEIINGQNTTKSKIISLLPGSRQNEIKYHLQLMLEAKKIIQLKLPDYKFQVLKPKELSRCLYEKFFQPAEIIDHSYRALAASEFVITASGTATIETAILEIPHLIIYKVNRLTWFILKNFVNIKFAGMLNILANKPLVPELIQKQANPEKIAALTLNYLRDESSYAGFKAELKQAKQLLWPQNAISRFAAYIKSEMQL